MKTRPYECRVYRSAEDGFPEVRDTAVLIYWPHGFGDWVFLSHILPLLEPSNRWFVTRFGDDNTALYDGCAIATPLYVGHNGTRCGDGADFGNAHFGLRAGGGGMRTLRLPLALHAQCVKHGIAAVADIPFWENYGKAEYPCHTKARSYLRQLAPAARLAACDLTRPLPSALGWDVPGNVRAWVEARLRTWGGLEAGRKLCVIARQGYTSVGKNWGHLWREDLPPGRQHEGEECRDFMRLLRRKDPAWFFVTMEERIFTGANTVCDAALECVSYADLFGVVEVSSPPFALVLKALLHFADLAVGVPAGPYHLAMAKPGLPTIGLWAQHWPAWYDEPKAESIHLVSRNLRDSGALSRPGSFSRTGALEFRTRELETRIIPGETVLAAAEELLGI